MKTISYLFLFLLGLAVVLIPAIYESGPGYMDAEYYYAGGLRLAEGHGFSEMILWNYLDDPSGLPHPSNAYWMPLASVLVSVGIKVFGIANFLKVRIIFLLIAGCLPPLTAALSYSLNKRRDAALLSGILAVFPAFYLPYLSTTDTFGPYMLLGAIFFLLVGRLHQDGLHDTIKNSSRSQILIPFLLGILAGLMHWTRADGILWLFVAWLIIGLYAFGGEMPNKQPGETSNTLVFHQRFSWMLLGFLSCLLGYLIVMGPWMVRNWAAFGSPLAPGGARALWINDYDELFIYPGSLLTPSHWLASGFPAILRTRMWAMGQNLVSALAVQGEVIITPLILMGMWRLHHDLRVQGGMMAWLLTFSVMTFVFPFAGVRGGFFHSGAALQPLFWAVAPSGLFAFVGWGGRARGWNIAQAQNVFGGGLVSLGILLSIVLAYNRIIGPDVHHAAWNASAVRYAQLDQALTDMDVGKEDVVLVNNPPGFFIASGRPAISIPYGNLETMLAVSERYHARYLLLEFNQLKGQDDLYQQPGDRPGLQYLTTVSDTRIYQILPSVSP